MSVVALVSIAGTLVTLAVGNVLAIVLFRDRESRPIRHARKGKFRS